MFDMIYSLACKYFFNNYLKYNQQYNEQANCIGNYLVMSERLHINVKNQ